MPIITKTVSGVIDGLGKLRNMTLNMAKSLAEIVGTTYGELSVSVEGHTNEKCYYVSMASVGYDGWFVVFNAYKESYDTIALRICRSLEGESSPDLDDPNVIRYITYGNNVASTITDYPETCVMIYDDAKDTVLFDIHHGTTTHGTDLTSYSGAPFDSKATIFFAKDVNGGVLCGIGNGYISLTRTTNAKQSKIVDKPTKKHDGILNTLHLTKMINYLDPSTPEMKSAYVSVVRPSASTIEEKRVSLYEAGGSRFGTVGNTDWAQLNHVDKMGILYQPINPFVKY